MSKIERKIEYSPIIVDKVSEHKYKEGSMSAQVRQIVTKITTYVEDTKQDSLFDEEPKRFENKQKRVCWIDLKGMDHTIESVQEQLNSYGEDAVIYQIVSYDVLDCLTDGQLYQVSNPDSDLTLEKLEQKCTLTDKEDKPILKDGKIIYRALYFSKRGRSDINHLTEVEQQKEKETATGSESEVA